MGGLLFLVVLTSAAGAAVTIGVRAVAEVVLIRRRLRAPPTPIADVRPGARVAVAGAIERGPARVAPLSGRECVTWQLVIQPIHVDAGRALRLQRGGELVLLDRGAAAVVETGEAELWWAGPSEGWIGELADHPRLLDAIATEVARDPAWAPTTRVSCQEWVLVRGQTIAACGRASVEPDPDGARRATGYRDELPRRVRLVGSSRQPVVVSDHVADPG